MTELRAEPLTLETPEIFLPELDDTPDEVAKLVYGAMAQIYEHDTQTSAEDSNRIDPELAAASVVRMPKDHVYMLYPNARFEDGLLFVDPDPGEKRDILWFKQEEPYRYHGVNPYGSWVASIEQVVGPKKILKGKVDSFNQLPDVSDYSEHTPSPLLIAANALLLRANSLKERSANQQ